jgi:glyoxylase-like metal-dependent hydrolase (beta-lactamase superfamily II)
MFVGKNEVTTVAEDTYYCSGFSGVTAFETGEGLVLVDTGIAQESAVLADRLREYTKAPVHTAVYTHGHLDHAFGLDAFLVDGQAPPEVIAHHAMPDRFDRYRRTAGHNEAINARQFGGTASPKEADAEASRFGWPEHPPTTLYRDDITLQIGGVTFEIHHGRGETDDHSWLYCPERDVLCTGDFVVGVAPNAGNPQKVQRYPWEWADVLREMAGTEAGTLCPGHGTPLVEDQDAVRERLLAGADYLDTIVDRTLDALNDGSPPHVDIVHEVDLPEPEAPWLAEAYDDGEFIVRNVLRYYGGWWSGRPSELRPAPRASLAGELADLAGDARILVERAETLADEGELRLAGHLADLALEAAPDDEEVRTGTAAVYEQRAAAAPDLMSRNIFAAAAEYAADGRRFR